MHQSPAFVKLRYGLKARPEASVDPTADFGRLTLSGSNSETEPQLTSLLKGRHLMRKTLITASLLTPLAVLALAVPASAASATPTKPLKCVASDPAYVVVDSSLNSVTITETRLPPATTLAATPTSWSRRVTPSRSTSRVPALAACRACSCG